MLQKMGTPEVMELMLPVRVLTMYMWAAGQTLCTRWKAGMPSVVRQVLT